MKHPSPHNAKGVALLEILIALVVTSIGLLGVAGLQVMSLKNNQSAALQSQANVLAYDMFDRLRANAGVAANYNIALTDSTPTGTSINKIDIQQWRGMLAASLPEGTGAIACNAAAPPVCRVTVQWKDESPFNPNTDKTSTIDLVSTL